MGKRSDFPRIDRDYYQTPAKACIPLISHLEPGAKYAEPCAGAGALIAGLSPHANCVYAADIEPQADDILQADAMDLTSDLMDMADAKYIITNPRWPAKHGRGEPTLSAIRLWALLRPTWLLLAADFAHNAYASEVLAYCPKIVSIGRVSWMGNGQSGVDNAAWFLFDQNHIGDTRYFGRVV